MPYAGLVPSMSCRVWGNDSYLMAVMTSRLVRCLKPGASACSRGIVADDFAWRTLMRRNVALAAAIALIAPGDLRAQIVAPVAPDVLAQRLRADGV